MAYGLELYDPNGRLVYSSNRFKTIKEVTRLEPSYVSLGGTGPTATWGPLNLTYNLPGSPRGIVMLGRCGGSMKLSSSPQTVSVVLSPVRLPYSMHREQALEYLDPTALILEF